MKQLRILAFAAVAMLAGTTWTSAQEAFTTGDVNMRAGPGTRYPAITTIPEGREVYIHGCLANWDWCDVSWRRDRGWVFSDYLEALYRNRRLSFYDYRRYVDLPVISFGFGYWDRHYRDRPWFGDWDHWRMRSEGDDEGGRRRPGTSNWSNDGGVDALDNADDDATRTDRTMRRNRNADERGRRDQCNGPDPDPSCPDGDGGNRGRRGSMNDQDQNNP